MPRKFSHFPMQTSGGLRPMLRECRARTAHPFGRLPRSFGTPLRGSPSVKVRYASSAFPYPQTVFRMDVFPYVTSLVVYGLASFTVTVVAVVVVKFGASFVMWGASALYGRFGPKMN